MPLKLTQAAPFLFVWLWSTGFVGAKYGLPYIEPFFMLLVRFAIVVVIFYLLVQIMRAKWLDKAQIAQQLLVGTLIHGGYLGGVFFAIKQGVPAGLAAIIVGLQPIVTTLACWLFLKQQINRSQLAGLSLGFVGISLVIVEKNAIDTSSLSALGIFACIVALICISAGTLLQKQYSEKVPLLAGSFYQYIGATLVVAVLSFSMETQTVIYSLELLAAMGWLIFGLSVLAILLLLYMIREGEVAKVTSYFYLVPPAAVIQTWWLFDESLGALALTGCICTVLGVYLVVKKASS
ncbi:EamA family transporter ['Osedax' symbiont bacterium Rs2_46_30_T18]|nr:EamA family transporter ['Osedax' symbiont bacterium Rs2_46_30_T18]